MTRRLSADLVASPGCELGEGPKWDEARGRLRFVDVLRGRVLWLDVDTEDVEVAVLGQPVGATARTADGGLLAAVRDGVGVLRRDAAFTLVIPIERDDSTMRMNDAQVDPDGRLFAGTMAFDETPGRGTLYRLDANLRLSIVLRGLTISNGLGWSPDGRRMYFVDSPERRVDVLDRDPATGAVSGRRPLADLRDRDGVPDGLAVDEAGGIWLAMWGGGAVLGLDADGRLRTEIVVPTPQVTSCAFGGPAHDRLFVTTAAMVQDGVPPRSPAGAVFACDVGVAGPPETPYAGRLG